MIEVDMLLEVKNLKVSFFTPSGEVKAVNDISYALGKGEVIGIVGESGSGKSVSANAVMGLIEKPGRIVGGSILFDGVDLATLNPEQRRKMRGKEIGMIFQDPMTSLNPVYTIGSQLKEAIGLYYGYRGRQADEKAIELLKLVSINEPERRLRQYPHEFSGGMRQRVMIAMALSGNPKLLIADEPTTALDVTIQAQILEILKELQGRINMSIMIITHDLGIVADIADNVAVMYGGRIVEYAPAEDIFRSPAHPYTRGLLNSIPKLDSRERLEPIEGSPIDLLNPPSGCPFAQRCKYCMKVCLNHLPPFTQVTEQHKAACWLLDERAPKEKIQ
ncbi:MAG: ABC transporter ATP-binding protein [Clostridia bacterium]|nr:ABC transporter ATP-binding protein [Clostridia bacterium]